ncbi:MAG: ABC transporter ATP-binding protein [Clostridia bacterium]|nr:ABC transporter ATP-binding protein [Clostridia bacterium]
MQSTFKWLWEHAKGLKKFFLFAVLASFGSIIFNFLSPKVIGFTVDSVIGDKAMSLPAFLTERLAALGGRAYLREHLIICAVGVIICAAGSAAFSFASRMSIVNFTESFVKRLRDRLFYHIQHLPFSWHVNNQTGDTVQRCTSDMDVIRNFIAQQLLQVVRTTVLIITALLLMFQMNVKLSLVAVVFIPLVASYSGIFFSILRRKFRQADEAEGELTVTVQENLTGMRVVRAFGRERHEIEKFNEKNNKFAGLWINMGKSMGLYWGIGDIATGMQVLAVTVGGALLAYRGELSLGDFLVFVSYTHTLAWPVRALGRTLSDMSKAGVSIARIREILDAEEEPREPDAQKPDIRQDIVFDDVSFMYNETPVLRHLSFTIPAGTTFGILGGTGSGKSTLTYLLNRLYDVPEGCGSIRIGGVDIRDIDRDYIRKNIGVVLQEPFLFSKTIGENISIALPEAGMDEIRRRASTAAVDESIMAFSKGYDTIVGERGVTLSGGQKQRVAIARTLMLASPVMIFDDSMSAVDLETDAQIREALRRDSGDSTVIIISHRINTLMQADNILVLNDDGSVEQVGTHSELIKREGLYRRIYEMQSEAAAAAEGGAL